MEHFGRVVFKNDEYLMEESLQRLRRQLIAMLEDDECLQCLTAICSCLIHTGLQVFQYQLFDSSPPACQVPKPNWIQDNWQSCMRIKPNNLDQSWERAKASTDTILTAKEPKETTKEACLKKVYSWLDAAVKTEKKVFVKVTKKKKLRINLLPTWPPIVQSPWCQFEEKPQRVPKQVNISVAAFFQRFAAPKLVVRRPDKNQAIFSSMLRRGVVTRMNVAYNGLPLTGNNVGTVAAKINCVM